MNVAFIVQVDLDDLGGLDEVAREIGQDLTDAGFEVKKVAPWQRPSILLGGTSLFQPEQPQQTIEPNKEPLL